MSAVPIPQPIRAICRTPASYFHHFLDRCNYTEVLCLGLILDLTVGASEAWRDIDEAEFRAATRETTKATIRVALAKLVAEGLIHARKNEITGRRQYRLSEHILAEVDPKGTRIRGRCPDCKTVGTFYSEYIAMPHPFFRKLGACLDHASFVCLAVICRYTLRWNGADGMWTDWKSLDFNDFKKLTGLDESSIQKALAKLADISGWRLIEKTGEPGKANFYRAIPERFGKIDRMGPRLVEQPKEKKRRTPPDKGDIENPSELQETPAIESQSKPLLLCVKCNHFIVPEDVPEEEFPTRDVSRPPRHGPNREKKSKTDILREELRVMREKEFGT